MATVELGGIDCYSEERGSGDPVPAAPRRVLLDRDDAAADRGLCRSGSACSHSSDPGTVGVPTGEGPTSFDAMLADTVAYLDALEWTARTSSASATRDPSAI
jgi:hypothetical protein